MGDFAVTGYEYSCEIEYELRQETLVPGAYDTSDIPSFISLNASSDPLEIVLTSIVNTNHVPNDRNLAIFATLKSLHSTSITSRFEMLPFRFLIFPDCSNSLEENVL